MAEVPKIKIDKKENTYRDYVIFLRIVPEDCNSTPRDDATAFTEPTPKRYG